MEALSQKFLDRFHLFEVRSSPNPGSRLLDSALKKEISSAGSAALPFPKVAKSLNDT